MNNGMDQLIDTVYVLLNPYQYPYPYHINMVFLGVVLFKSVIMLFISINESTVNYILLSESIKLFCMCVIAFSNL